MQGHRDTETHWASEAIDWMDSPLDPVRCAVAFLAIQTEQETDGRWIAEIPDLPGVMSYGDTREDACRLARQLAVRVIRDRLFYGEELPAVLFPRVVIE